MLRRKRLKRNCLTRPGNALPSLYYNHRPQFPSFIERDERTDGRQFQGIAVLSRPRSAEQNSITHVSGTFCYYVSGRLQMLSCKAARGKDLPKVQHSLIRQESVDR